MVTGYFFVVANPVGMRMPFNNRISRKKGSPKEGSAYLANAAANPLDRSAAINDQSFCKAIIQTDIAQSPGHGEGLSRCHQQAVKPGGGGSNILYAFGAGPIKVGRLCSYLFRNPQRVCCSIIFHGRILIIKHQGDIMLTGCRLLLNGADRR